MPIEIKPCPFCGSNRVSFHEDEPQLMEDTTTGFIWCHGCNFSSDSFYSEKIAAAAWNRRAPERGRTMNELERAIEHFTHGITHDIFKEPVATHARLAVSALREQAEREEGCEYCNGPSNAYVAIQKFPTRGMIGTAPNFCPMCGRRLEVKHAVLP